MISQNHACTTAQKKKRHDEATNKKHARKQTRQLTRQEKTERANRTSKQTKTGISLQTKPRPQGRKNENRTHTTDRQTDRQTDRRKQKQVSGGWAERARALRREPSRSNTGVHLHKRRKKFSKSVPVQGTVSYPLTYSSSAHQRGRPVEKANT